MKRNTQEPSRRHSQAGLARLLRLNPETLRLWRRRGCPATKSGHFIIFDLAEVRRWREARKAGTPPTLTGARVRKILADAAMSEQSLAFKSEQLVARTDVDKAWGAIISNARAKLLPLGSKLAPLLLALASIPEMKKIIDDEVYAVLTELAAFEPPSQKQGNGIVIPPLSHA